MVLLNSANNNNNNNNNNNSNNNNSNSNNNNNNNNNINNKLHGQFWRNTAEGREQKTWESLKKDKLKKEKEGMIMAAQDQALRTNLASKMCLQSVECAEKLIRQLAILYRNSRNFLTSNIDIGGSTRWRRWFSGTYVESWFMTEMKNSTTS